MIVTRLTREIAWAASIAAGNRSARAAGRGDWNWEDRNVAVREFDRLWPLERDLETKGEEE